MSGRPSCRYILSNEVFVWLSVWSMVQIVCIWSSWCHYIPKPHHLLPHLNPTVVLPFWYRFTQVVLVNRPLNGCSIVVQCISLSHLLSRRRISVFGHVARLDDNTLANMALQLHINVSLNRPPDRTWRRPPGRPRNKWLDQLRNDSTRPTGELWRRAVDLWHGGATTRRPSPATRTWWQ